MGKHTAVKQPRGNSFLRIWIITKPSLPNNIDSYIFISFFTGTFGWTVYGICVSGLFAFFGRQSLQRPEVHKPPEFKVFLRTLREKASVTILFSDDLKPVCLGCAENLLPRGKTTWNYSTGKGNKSVSGRTASVFSWINSSRVDNTIIIENNIWLGLGGVLIHSQRTCLSLRSLLRHTGDT